MSQRSLYNSFHLLFCFITCRSQQLPSWQDLLASSPRIPISLNHSAPVPSPVSTQIHFLKTWRKLCHMSTMNFLMTSSHLEKGHIRSELYARDPWHPTYLQELFPIPLPHRNNFSGTCKYMNVLSSSTLLCLWGGCYLSLKYLSCSSHGYPN